MLLPPDIKIPRIGETDGVPPHKRKVPVKIFDPCGRGTWYVLEYDGKDELFTYVISPLGPDCDEYGYASLTELSTVKNRLGLKLERDLHWDPETLLSSVADL